MKLKLLGILALSMLISVSIFQSCTISLSGATLDPELKTFYIPNFTNNAENALPSLSQRLTEDLKDKVRAESRLVLSEEEPDIEFRGTLVDYRITAEAPRTGESTAINRLTITLAISYFNNRKNTEIWQKNFSFF
ncbi:MAG: LPS assembly lipoprotein LptE, partial [Bacteroidota bacterium]